MEERQREKGTMRQKRDRTTDRQKHIKTEMQTGRQQDNEIEQRDEKRQIQIDVAK